MDNNNNIMDNNNITNTINTTNIKSSKKIRSFKKKKKVKPILSQHGGAKYDFDDLIGIETKDNMRCWVVSAIQMLWNIDDLRDYFLHTSETVIKGLKPMNKIQKEEEQTKEKKRISDLVNYKHKYIIPEGYIDVLEVEVIDIVEDVDENSPLYNDKRDFPSKGISDTIEVKQNMILALKSIFIVYKKKIDEIKAKNPNSNNEAFKMEYGGDTKNILLDKKLIALMNELLYTTIAGEQKDPIDEIIKYYNIKEGAIPEDIPGDKAGDPIYLIKLTFLLFEDIQDDKIIELKKWFRVCILYIDKDNARYKINFKNIIDIIPEKRCNLKTELCNLQLKINTDYINPNAKKINLILFQETKFLLFTINDISLFIQDGSKDNFSIEANKTINIYNRNYMLRGCIMHTGANRASGHETFLAYNNEGEKAALLNGSYKINLLEVNDDHVAKRDLKPNTEGTLYLYELADGDTDLAASLAGSLAIAPDPRPPPPAPPPHTPSVDEDERRRAEAQALREAAQREAAAATKAAAAGTKTAAAAQREAAAAAAREAAQREAAARAREAAAAASLVTSHGDDDPTNRAVIQQQDEIKDIKPYNASLDIPSGESNGENMVLGILLVITLAITGVLFVQR